MSRGADQIFTNVSLASRLSFGSIHMFKKKKKRCKNNISTLVL
jgi:hypothetical protein